jgi:hypothetical protein
MRKARIKAVARERVSEDPLIGQPSPVFAAFDSADFGGRRRGVPFRLLGANDLATSDNYKTGKCLRST